MMNLSRRKRAGGDSVVPMINVAFLLLIFFLMTAVLVPPDPFQVTPPQASAMTAKPVPGTLVISADGDLALGQTRGEAIYAALPEGPLRIRADADLDGAQLVAIVGRLADAGVVAVELITVSR